MEAKKRRSTRRKRSTTTPRRRKAHRTHLSAAPRKTGVRRHKRRSTSKSGLSEMFNKPAMNTTLKAIASGVVGAFVGGMVIQFFPNEKPLVKAGILAAAGLVIGSALKMPNVAAGFTGMGLYNVLKGQLNPGVSEGYLSQADLEQLPAVLSEDYQLSASPMALAESPFQFAQ